MATIVYLDVEDEITSAASRIRSAGESRVALVLPFGSRLATSRINFRLLAREAMTNGRRLDIVAPDASARALAASAGLPVFASVAEYEAALDQPGGTAAGVAGVSAGAAAGAEDAGAVPGTRVTGGRPGPARGAAGGAGGRMPPEAVTTGAALADAEPFDDEAAARRRGEPKVVHAPRRRRVGAGVLAGVGVLVFALVVAGVAGYLFLPSAEITVTPRIESIGPISLTVRADPSASSVDTESGVIPAQTVTIPVESSGEFPATGKRVEQTAATGGVRWTNCDPTAAYTIPKGTIVKTSTGIGFSTDEQVFLPVAIINAQLDLKCQTSEVSVTAVKPGPDGNVDADTIRVVPARYNRNVIRVTNPNATSGGARTEFKRISQKDVDAAVEQLRKDLDASFATAVGDPANVPPGATVFPATAILGEPSTDVDPATLVNQEVESFTLHMTASGTVLAVDSSPVKQIAEARLQGSVGQGYQLVPGSISVTVGEGTVVGGVVTFPAEGSARQVRPLDAEALKRKVLGLGEREARAVLEPYGDVQLTLWPNWVSTVPGFAQRVTLTVAQPAEPAASGGPGSTGAPSLPPGSGSDAPATEPVPSG